MNPTYTRELFIGLVLLSSAIGAAALAADPATGTDGDRQAQARARLQACRSDAQHFCSDVEAGGGHKMACLRMHIAELTPACRDALPNPAARNGGPSTNDGTTK